MYHPLSRTIPVDVPPRRLWILLGGYGAAVVASTVAGPVGPIVALLPAVAVLVGLTFRWDAVSLLSVLLVLLYGISARYVLGAFGPPTAIVGLLCLALWGLLALRERGLPPRNPVRAASLVLAWFLLLGSAVSFTRILTVAEASETQRRSILLLAAVGVTLLAADRIRDRGRLDDLLRVVVFGASFMAFVGIVQYVTGRDISEALILPGLTRSESAATAIAERSSIRRVAGTANHAIEFGVVLAMVLPLALHYAMIARRRGPRLLAWGQVAIIGTALPLSLSRSAVLSLAAALLTAMTVWSARRKLNVLVAFLVSLVIFRMTVPGVLGTLRALFLWVDEDPSVTGRTDDYSIVWQFVSERPLFGRGLGTFLPTQYIFLDNQFLGLLIEVGIVGFLVTIGWLLVGVSCARGVRRRAVDPEDRQLGQAIVAGILAALVSFATFDALGFAIVTYTLFLLVGGAGALWRLTASERDPTGVPATANGATT